MVRTLLGLLALLVAPVAAQAFNGHCGVAVGRYNAGVYHAPSYHQNVTVVRFATFTPAVVAVPVAVAIPVPTVAVAAPQVAVAAPTVAVVAPVALAVDPGYASAPVALGIVNYGYNGVGFNGNYGFNHFNTFSHVNNVHRVGFRAVAPVRHFTPAVNVNVRGGSKVNVKVKTR